MEKSDFVGAYSLLEQLEPGWLSMFTSDTGLIISPVSEVNIDRANY